MGGGGLSNSLLLQVPVTGNRVIICLCCVSTGDRQFVIAHLTPVGVSGPAVGGHKVSGNSHVEVNNGGLG